MKRLRDLMDNFESWFLFELPEVFRMYLFAVTFFAVFAAAFACVAVLAMAFAALGLGGPVPFFLSLFVVLFVVPWAIALWVYFSREDKG